MENCSDLLVHQVIDCLAVIRIRERFMEMLLYIWLLFLLIVVACDMTGEENLSDTFNGLFEYELSLTIEFINHWIHYNDNGITEIKL